MNRTVFERSPQVYVRVAGILYLAIILLGLYGEAFVRQSLVSANPAETASNIANSLFLWRSSIAGDILMHLFDVPVIVVFYLLLRPVNEGLALLATCFNLLQTAILATNKLNLLIPVFLQDRSRYLKAFTSDQLDALTQVSIDAHGHGFGIGLIFFGIACVIRGYLIYRSKLFPKFLGVLLAIAGLSYLINSFALILSPSIASMMFPAILMPAFIGELALCLWLIVKGIDLKSWSAHTIFR